MPENQVATQGGAMALSPEDMELMVTGAQTGVETFSMRQMIVPYLGIVQGVSDYVKRGHASFIESARVGDIIDSLAQRPMSEAYVIPCKFEEHVTEWEVKVDRDGKRTRGKLVRQWFTDHSKYQASQKRGADDGEGFPRITSEGNDINMVPTYYCLLHNQETGGVRPVVLPLGSTQARKSRRWNGLIDAVEFNGPNGPMTAPIYAVVYKLTTATEGEGDRTYMGWKIEPAGFTLAQKGGRQAWQRAQEVRKAVEDGLMKMAAPVERDVTNEATATTTTQPARGAGDRSPPPPDGDDIPF